MKVKHYYIIILLACTLGTTAQNNSGKHRVNINIPEVALLDLESNGTNNIILSPVASNEAGAPVDFSNSKNNSLWINYSSIVGSNTEPTRNVVVSVSQEIPAALNLKVQASVYSGNGKGNMGTPSGEVVLTTTPKEIIQDIGSCYTGNGPNKGHQLTYSLELKDEDDYALLDFDQSEPLIVTYTLTDVN